MNPNLKYFFSIFLGGRGGETKVSEYFTQNPDLKNVFLGGGSRGLGVGGAWGWG